MKYIVYQTINKINNKIYIGVHKTENPNIFDGYIGCGAFTNKPSSYNKGKTHLHNALLKYGISNFYRKTLKTFDTLEEALYLEAQLVNDDFIKRTDTYNMTVGGGIPPSANKTVYQFDLEGKMIKKWDSIVEITEAYDCNHDRILMCVRDKRSFDNSYWSYEQEINIENYRLSNRGYVYQYNKDGVLLNTFKNASEAALQLDLNRDSIVSAVFDRCTCNGYYFLRPNEDIYELLNSKKTKVNARTTPIYRYKETGEFDCEFASATDAVKSGISRSQLKKAIEKNEVSKGYRWSYVKSDTIVKYDESQKKKVKIAQYDLEHNLIKIWDSVSECKAQYPSCQKVCKKQRKSTNGYIFEYIS